MPTPPTAAPDDIAALRDGAACLAPDLHFAVQLAGSDQRAWLERIASNPVADITPGEARLATLMDGKGKLRAELLVVAPPGSDDLLLELPLHDAEATLRLLDMYIIKDDVQLRDLRPERRFVSLLGPRAREVAVRAGLALPTADGAASSRAAVTEEGALVLPSRLLGPACGYDVLAPLAAADALLARLREAGARAVEVAALDVVRIERGVPWFGPDLSGGVIPLEAGLRGHLSITKGCYPGQEVVARILNLGQVARRLVRLSAPGRHALAPGTELTGTGEHEGKPAGTLTSVAYDPTTDRTVALGFARRAHWSTGAEVRAGEVLLGVSDPAD